MNTLKGTADGMIQLDSQLGKELGFTPDKFSEDSYLWFDGGRVWISFIASVREGQGNLSALLKAIESRGWRVAVPTPSSTMQSILQRKGFVMHIEPTYFGPCQVWERPSPW